MQYHLSSRSIFILCDLFGVLSDNDGRGIRAHSDMIEKCSAPLSPFTEAAGSDCCLQTYPVS